MSICIHPATFMFMGDPDHNPLYKKPDPEKARAFFDSLILSASGWRGVFGKHDDDLDGTPSPAALYAAGRMASVFADYVMSLFPAEPVRIAVGIDTRPTGPALADAMIRVFLAKGLAVDYGFIMSAPEIMAFVNRQGILKESAARRASSETGQNPGMHGFCYISASHNPPGHNGVKFGLGDGGVLAPAISAGLIAALKDGACSREDIDHVAGLMQSATPETVAAVFTSATAVKRYAMSDYLLFSREIFTGIPSADMEEQESVFDLLAGEAERYGTGIIAEMNGSSRSLSIDENFITSIGAKFRQYNNVPGHFVHRIVPEGASLDDCRRYLQEAHGTDGEFELGYVPDCDGDRGNIVLWDEERQTARPLEAQETFALAVLSELSYSAVVRGHGASGQEGNKPLAVVCNDATSLRVEAIANALGAKVFRTETGEANVVSKARQLREEGWRVRILGEGSNGGVIIHPSSVRDPLSTIGSLLKLSVLRGRLCPFHHWLGATGRGESYFETFGLSDVADSLPRWTTTSVFEKRAALTIAHKSAVEIKQLFYDALPAFQDKARSLLGSVFAEPRFSVLQSSGTLEAPVESRDAIGKGGLKVLIQSEGVPVGFVWMRESGTEPLFRIMADIQGNHPDIEAALLELLESIIRKLDR